MIRETALFITVLFAVPIYLLAAGPVIEDLTDRVDESGPANELGMADNLGTLRTVMFIGVPLVWAGGWSMWYFLFAIRRDSYATARRPGL